MSWQTGIEVITLFVDDLESSKVFYGKKFGLPVGYEDSDSVVFDCGNVGINLRSRSSARRSFDATGLLGTYTVPSMQVTIDVDDLDVACADLSRRGMTMSSPPTDRAGGYRNASFLDPDGYAWEITEQMPQSQSPVSQDISGIPLDSSAIPRQSVVGAAATVPAAPRPHPLAAAI